jgi:hypothetical protein
VDSIVSFSLGDPEKDAMADKMNVDWVSEFAPRSQSKFLSYTVGWLAALGWQALVATTGESYDIHSRFTKAALIISQYVRLTKALFSEHWMVYLLTMWYLTFLS